MFLFLAIPQVLARFSPPNFAVFGTFSGGCKIFKEILPPPKQVPKKTRKSENHNPKTRIFSFFAPPQVPAIFSPPDSFRFWQVFSRTPCKRLRMYLKHLKNCGFSKVCRQNNARSLGGDANNMQAGMYQSSSAFRSSLNAPREQPKCNEADVLIVKNGKNTVIWGYQLSHDSFMIMAKPAACP